MKLMIDTKNRTHEVRFVSSIFADIVHIHMDDDRLLSEIAAEFEGLAHFEVVNAANPNAREAYDGYSEVTVVERYADGSVRLTLSKKE